MFKKQDEIDAGTNSSQGMADFVYPVLAEIEIKLSYSEDLLEELNRTVFLQQQQIELLQQELRALRLQLQADNGSAAPLDLRDETPPHY